MHEGRCFALRLSVYLALSLALLAAAAAVARAADAPSSAPSSALEAETPKPPAKKVLVIAAVPDMNRRGVVEEAFRAEFAALGIEVLTSIGYLTSDDFASQDALRAKIESLGVDAVFGLQVENVDKSAGSSGSVSVGVAAPVSGGGPYGHSYGGYGPYSAFVGVSKPIGDTKVTARTTSRLLFFNAPVWPAWEKVVKNSFDKDDLDVTAAKIARSAVKELKKKNLVAGP